MGRFSNYLIGICLFVMLVFSFASISVAGEIDKTLFAPNDFTCEEGYGGTLCPNARIIYDFFVDSFINTNGLVREDAQQLISKSFDDGFYTYDSRSDLSNYVLYAVTAFSMDYPEVFWLGAYDVSFEHCSRNDVSMLSKIDFNMCEYYKDSFNKAKEHNEGIICAINEIKEKYLKGSDSIYYYEAIHDWCVDHLTFDITGDNAVYTTIPVFTQNGNGHVVCNGYSKSFKILCDWFKNNENVDINAAIVAGIGNGGGKHCWNEVLIDGKWYAIDVTWDDQISNQYGYYLKGSQSECIYSTFGQEHCERDIYNDSCSIHFERPELEKCAYEFNSITN